MPESRGPYLRRMHALPLTQAVPIRRQSRSGWITDAKCSDCGKFFGEGARGYFVGLVRIKKRHICARCFVLPR